MNGRTLLAALASVLAVAAGAAAQTPDDFPSRPIRIIVPQAAGSGVDLQARVLAQKMDELWGQPGIVENRPGANAIVGMEAGAKAKPDGDHRSVGGTDSARIHDHGRRGGSRGIGKAQSARDVWRRARRAVSQDAN